MVFTGISHSGVDWFLEGSGSGDAVTIIRGRDKQLPFEDIDTVCECEDFFSLFLLASCFWMLLSNQLESVTAGKKHIKQQN